MEIPQEVHDLFAPIWQPRFAGRLHGTRPWWAFWQDHWTRCDAVRLSQEESLADYDRERPLPVPPPVAGQVWVLRDGDQASVVAVSRGWATLIRTDNVAVAGTFGVSSAEWPPFRALLVAGPSPWGRDVPWAPQE